MINLNELTTYQVALFWREFHGVATFPVKKLNYRDKLTEKKPALDSWKAYQTRLPTDFELSNWFLNRDYNIALATGWNGLTVLDFDNLEFYSEWLNKDRRNQQMAMWTFSVQTAKGMHLYFYCDDTEIKNAQDRERGFDARGVGGYVITAPSIHPTGAIYKAHGDPVKIMKISSIWDIIEKPQREEIYQDSVAMGERDIFDSAMVESAGVGIDDVKSRHTIYEVLGIAPSSSKVQVRCPSPFHDDRHPSCTVYPDGHVYCFSCGFSGDLIDCYAAIHRLSLQDAMRELG